MTRLAFAGKCGSSGIPALAGELPSAPELSLADADLPAIDVPPPSEAIASVESNIDLREQAA